MEDFNKNRVNVLSNLEMGGEDRPKVVPKEEESILDKVSRLILMVSIFVFPLIFYPNNLHSIFNLKAGVFYLSVLLVLLLWSVSSLKKDTFNPPLNLLFLSVVVLLAATLISAVLSINPMVSIFGSGLSMVSFMGTLTLFILALLISKLFIARKHSHYLNFSVYSSLLVTVVVHLLYIITDSLFTLPDFGFFVSNVANTVGKWSDLGVLAALLVLLSYLILETRRVSVTLRTMSWIGLVSGALTVLIVNTTTIWVVLGTLSVIFLVYKIIVSKQQSNKSFQKGISAPALVVVLLSFFMILSGGLVSNMTNNLFDIRYEETKPSIGSTIKVTREVIFENPVLGYGPNRFEHAWQDFKPAGVNLSNYWGVDFGFGYSYFLTVPVSVGVLGFLALLFFLMVIVASSFKLLFKQGEDMTTDNSNVSEVFAVLFFVVVFAVHVPSLVVFGLGFVYLGLLVASLNREGLYKTVSIDIGSRPKVGFIYVFSMIVLMIASIYLIYLTSRQFVSRILVESANANLVQGDNIASERRILNAVNIYGSDFNYRLLSDYYKIQISDLLTNSNSNNEAVVDRFRSLLSSSINASRSAIAFDGSNYLNYLSLANTYQQLIGLGVQGSYEQAKIEYQRAFEQNPTNPGILLDMARSAFFVGNNEEAKSLIGQAIGMKPNFADAAFLLAQIQVAEGNIQEAVNSVEAAVAVDPTNSNLYFQLGLLRYNQANYVNAIAAFESAVIRNPVFSNAKYFLGLSYEREGRTSDAIQQFEDLKILNPGNPEVDLVLDNLKSGNSPFQDAQAPIDDEPENRDGLPLEEGEVDVSEEDLEVENGEQS